MGKGRDSPRQVSTGQETRLCRYWEGLERGRDLFMEPSVGPSCAGNFTDILSFNPDNLLLSSLSREVM